MDLVEVNRRQPEAAQRGARSDFMSAPRTSSFHGDGMNLEAITTDAARWGSRANMAPMIRSLSPRPYTSAVSNNVTPASIEASHASRIESVSARRRSPPCPTWNGRPRPRSAPERRDRDLRAAEDVVVRDHERTVPGRRLVRDWAGVLFL